MPPPSPGRDSPELAGPCTGQVGAAQVPLPAGGMWEDLCFWAQQAAELAIKAVYQQHGWLFPFIHDLAQLLNGLQLQGLTIPAEVQQAQSRLSSHPGTVPRPGRPGVRGELQRGDQDRQRRRRLG